ncbi:MAG TPA: helix-turn-helix transcriptional regulator [Planctomycetaceae bacterium]|nr:helix-turn-helix transcriptional regulator [Planctomycetaceae bacterium]
MKTIDVLFDESQLTIEDVAERARLAAERVEAIAVGRWTPSPEERRRIAAAFGVPVEEVSWGHSMDPRNIRYHRFGLKENF